MRRAISLVRVATRVASRPTTSHLCRSEQCLGVPLVPECHRRDHVNFVQRRHFGKARSKTELETVHQVPRGHSSITQAFSLSGGKGGQNVNKVNTKVQLFFKVDEADWLPDEVKLRLKTAAKNVLNKDGEIVVSSTATRSQHTNLRDAYQKLQMLVDSATIVPHKVKIKDQPSKFSKKRMVEKKRRRSEVKKGRSKRFDDF